VANGHRLTIRSIDTDPRIKALQASADHLGLPSIGALGIADVILVDADVGTPALDDLASVLVDPLLQQGSWDLPSRRGVEVTTLAGVTNSAADAVLRAAGLVGVDITAAGTALRLEFDDDAGDDAIEEFVTRLVANPIVERWTHGFAEMNPQTDDTAVGTAEIIPIRWLDDDALFAVDRARSLSLDLEELHVIREHFEKLDRDPTDVELETLAQTWSEHCAHKTFRASIDLHDGIASRQVEPLMRQLRNSTENMAAPFVRSAFVGNAGVIEFTPGTTLAVKAETHNHPSAVEPFGGANTGVGGVIRDVLGIAHRPIAVTNVLCFGPSDLPLADLPEGSLHPLRIRAGVVDGVADYGNKIGLPTIAGAVLYDPAYTTNPLVFAGCIGSADARPVHDGPFPGDRVVVLGGATGRDGIRGATFSSATMDATTGEVAGASVQIGDPIVEKLLIDALVGAEDLFSAITDCGAGGLSSAVGEMAEGIGADVELDLVPRKYPGLEPWEVWLSEAQERMVVAVPPAMLRALADRCDRFGVELADIGEFTGTGQLVVRSGGVVVADLDTVFLHDGRPQRRMNATTVPRIRDRDGERAVADPMGVLLDLLSHPNIASKEAIIRRYDHEILGSTVIRPLVGVHADGPGDGVVIAPPATREGFAVGIGVNPWYGLHDPEHMAIAVVDEAIRNVVAVGADPDRVALLDNFSWGDPRRESTLGELVEAVAGCCVAADLYGAPFVSGKDSLNNEYIGNDGQRHAVPPTLVITAIAHVPDADACISSDLTAPGNVLLMVGRTRAEFAGSHLDLVIQERMSRKLMVGAHGPVAGEVGPAPAPDLDAPDRYRRLHRAIRSGLVRSCHDLSEGGFAVALAEMCIGGRLGATIRHLPHRDVATALFAESIGRLIVEVEPGDVDTFTAQMNGEVAILGAVTADGILDFDQAGSVDVVELVAAFTGTESP
jgi:phosphoribosylformylglycinamidine synthase II